MPYSRRGCICYLHAFMIRSGLNVPTPAIPIPDLAVPYAAPSAATVSVSRSCLFCPYNRMLDDYHIPPKIIFERIVSENRSYGATVTEYTHCRGNASLTNCQLTTSQAYLVKTKTIEDTYKGEERCELRGVLAVRHDGPGGGREEIEENKNQSSERRIVDKQQQNKSSSNQSKV